jgi:biopolymer transport protein ExbB/TolQ
MPWWGWVVIWGGLSLVLVIFLSIIAFVLIRKGLGVVTALGDLASSTELLERAADASQEQGVELAILAERNAVLRQRDRVRAASAARSAGRHDARIARAKALTAEDVTSREWFTDN